MHATTILSAALTTLLITANAQDLNATVVTGILGNASVVENNPPGETYLATLPDISFVDPEDPRGNIQGFVKATANPNGIGVSFEVLFSNLPTSGGPFLYHLHDQPVPEDGNCTDTLAHLDPYQRGETPSCDEQLPQTCQVGDLSGKHGKIESDPTSATYTDEFASTTSGIGAFFGNRSFVVHFANKTRITCANFLLIETSTSSNTTANVTSPAGSPIPFTGGATHNSIAPIGILFGAVSLAFMLL